MMHYSAGVAKVRSVLVQVDDLWDPIVRKDLRVILYKAMEADYSALSGVNLTPAEQRVMDNFQGWLADIDVQSKCVPHRNAHSRNIHGVETPAFVYVNLNTGTNLLFVATLDEGDGWETALGHDLERTTISLS